MSLLPSLSSMAALSVEQRLYACFSFKNTTVWLASQITHEGSLRSFIQHTKERLFQNESRQSEPWTSTFPCFNHHESWAAVPTSVIAISLTLRWKLARTNRETAGLRHYHCHPRSNPLYFFLSVCLSFLFKSLSFLFFLLPAVMVNECMHTVASTRRFYTFLDGVERGLI